MTTAETSSITFCLVLNCSFRFLLECRLQQRVRRLLHVSCFCVHFRAIFEHFHNVSQSVCPPSFYILLLSFPSFRLCSFANASAPASVSLAIPVNAAGTCNAADPLITRAFSPIRSDFFSCFFHDLEYEDPFSCSSMFILARGWLSFISCAIFFGPVVAAGALAAVLVAAVYVSVYVVLVMPILCVMGKSIRLFPDFIGICE